MSSIHTPTADQLEDLKCRVITVDQNGKTVYLVCYARHVTYGKLCFDEAVAEYGEKNCVMFLEWSRVLDIHLPEGEGWTMRGVMGVGPPLSASPRRIA